jgi:hypothetical protein
MNAETINISAPLHAICELLGVEYNAVLAIHFTPGETTVDVLKKSEQGPYTDPATGQLAQDRHVFQTIS